MGLNYGINVTLTNYDRFGQSVALENTSLAIGADGDDGYMDVHDSAGAVYLYSFADSLFNGAIFEGNIGYWYTGGKNIDQTPLLACNDLGMAVSLNNNRLAASTLDDSGFYSAVSGGGNVFVYNFEDNSFTNGKMLTTFGADYGWNQLYPSVEGSDDSGTSIAIDDNMLAVGAPDDDGLHNLDCNSGAVYLYSFLDNDFSGAALEGVIGNGYTGGKNINQPLDDYDYFGYSLSLNTNRLAVGAIGDDGSDGTATDSGAVYLYSFTDSAFNDGTLEAIIGDSYTTGKNIDQQLDNNDYFGSSVSLYDNSIAIGAFNDDGFGASGGNDYGAVYLYTFSSSTFASGNLEGIIGENYTFNAKDIDITLDIDDYFGCSVSLNNNRLAIGAYGDDGGIGSETGAVYLYSFDTSDFTNGTLQAIIGNNYSGGKNIDQSLDDSDYFGRSVSLDNYHLAVGAIGDDGASNSGSETGAVYLYTFSDSLFSGGSLNSIYGLNYTSGNNVKVGLDNCDYYGRSVSLNANRLAVGAPGDDSYNNGYGETGAVYLYTYTDDNFSNTKLEKIIGYGYPNTFNMHQSLGDDDNYGQSVSFNDNMLAVSAINDDGFGNLVNASGAVYLYSFTGTNFAGGTLEAIIGDNYTGGKNYNQNLDTFDQFGTSVSLDGLRLAIGAPYDNGSGNTRADSGAVYLYTFDDSYFTNINHIGTLGYGYIGANDTNIPLAISDLFGNGVSLDGLNLVVGSPGNDGLTGTITDAGAAYLFQFSDLQFSGGATLIGTIGNGYTGGSSYNLNLDLGDSFGWSVALDDKHIIVGAPNDDGQLNAGVDTGAVHLFRYNDSDLDYVYQYATIGLNYDGCRCVNQTLDDGDQFGSSVAFNINKLAVGAPYDDGYLNINTDSGAVYYYSFTTPLDSATLELTIGFEYDQSASSNYHVYLDNNDYFGASVSIDGPVLAIGASGDDGYNNGCSNLGAVYLFKNFEDSIYGLDSYDYKSDQSITLSSNTLEYLLSSGQNVILQANNDITFNDTLYSFNTL